MSEFKKGDRVQMGYRMMRSVHGTVVDPKTPYGMVEVLWDDEVEVEDTYVKRWDLTAVTNAQECKADLELARELLAKHGLSFPIVDYFAGANIS